MHRCAICDVTDQDNPKAGIKTYDIQSSACQEYLGSEPRCLDCQSIIQENIEDLSIADEDFAFAEK